MPASIRPSSVAVATADRVDWRRSWLNEGVERAGSESAKKLGRASRGHRALIGLGIVLERENRELRQANEILRKASAYFGMAELDRRSKP